MPFLSIYVAVDLKHGPAIAHDIEHIIDEFKLCDPVDQR